MNRWHSSQSFNRKQIVNVGLRRAPHPTYDLKLRNPDNAPDAWEKSVLASFEKRKVAGETPATLESFAVIEEDGHTTFRYMKAIPTGGVCLACHGDSPTPDVVKKLDELYPEDQARGFAVGDLRGAFTLKKRL